MKKKKKTFHWSPLPFPTAAWGLQIWWQPFHLQCKNPQMLSYTSIQFHWKIKWDLMVIILLGSNSISLPLFFWVLIPEKSEIFPSHCHLLWIKRFLVTKVAWIKGYPEYAWIFPLVAECEKWARNPEYECIFPLVVEREKWGGKVGEGTFEIEFWFFIRFLFVVVHYAILKIAILFIYLHQNIFSSWNKFIESTFVCICNFYLFMDSSKVYGLFVYIILTINATFIVISFLW